MSKFADEKVEEFEERFKHYEHSEVVFDFLHKTIAEAEKRGVEKIIDNLKERYVTHKFQIKSSDSFCEGLKVAIETSEKKQLEGKQ